MFLRLSILICLEGYPTVLSCLQVLKVWVNMRKKAGFFGFDSSESCFFRDDIIQYGHNNLNDYAAVSRKRRGGCFNCSEVMRE